MPLSRLEAALAGAVVAVLAAIIASHRHRRRRPLRCHLDLEERVDRRGMHAVKHELLPSLPAFAADVLQLWVADMEFACAPHIVGAITARSTHPTFGYTFQPRLIWQQAACWLVEHQGWPHAPPPDAFVFSASVVASFAHALRALTTEGAAVVVMVPAYAPLLDCIVGTGRRLITHPLRRCGASLEMDLPALRQTLERERASVLLLINPHNPGGRVWSRDELGELAAICAALGVLVISDEVWGDWCLGPRPLTPFAAVGAACPHLTLNAPTKSFNLAGLHCSYCIIEDRELMRRYRAYVEPATLHFGGTFASVALLAAYDAPDRSAAWLDEARAYVRANAEWFTAYALVHLPGVVPISPLEATYLLWLDCAGLMRTHGLAGADALAAFCLERAQLHLSPGCEFDPTGASDSCMRINLACPRALVEEAAERLRHAIASPRVAVLQCA